jgi:chromosome segregation ATPase
MESSSQNNKERKLKEQLEGANNRKMTPITIKAFQSDLSDFYINAQEQGRTAEGLLAYLIRKFNRGELLIPDEQEAGGPQSKHLKEDEGDKKPPEPEKSGSNTDTDLQEMQKKLKEANDKLAEKEEKLKLKDNQYNKLRQDFDDISAKHKEAKKEAKKFRDKYNKKKDEYNSEFNRRKLMESRLEMANEWIGKHTGRATGLENPGNF